MLCYVMLNSTILVQIPTYCHFVSIADGPKALSAYILDALHSKNPSSIQKHKWNTQTRIILTLWTEKGERELKSIGNGFEPSSISRQRNILHIDYQAVIVWVLDSLRI